MTGLIADCAAQLQTLVFGNPGVQPETSTTYTLGLIWEPSPGLSATLDYWNIKSKKQITVADVEAVLADPSAFPSSTVLRDTNNLLGIPNSGTLLIVSSPWENGNSVSTSWNRGAWTVTGTVHYVSDYQSIYFRGAAESLGCIADGLDTPPDCHVSSFTTLDLSASYTGFKNWQIFGSVINVFNRIAPFNPAAAYGNVNFNYNYAYSGGTGTQFNLGARNTF